jgi:oxalate---CoA ligase
VPRRITIVDQLPKGITGKVQRKRLSEALREKSEQAGLSEEALHASLAQLWKRVLKVNSISLDDDFFEKGGDSLLAMDVSLELQQLMGRELPESILFEAPTIRELAKQLTWGKSQPG